jgi:recombination protein RecA
MPSASALRIQIENALERRFPSALTPQPRTIRETASTGIPEVDRLLDGGLPVGAISEITGPVSSGRTSLALAFLAQRTSEDRVCAWVDANDSFDSESAAANGVALKQLLWVRCKNPLPVAQPSARPNFSRPDFPRPDSSPIFSNLAQALRATDLLLQAGGFAALVIDLGSAAPEHAAKVPLATWFRFRQAADRTRCSLLVLAQEPLTQSSAAVVLECAPLATQSANQTILSGCSYQVRTGRQASSTKTLSIAGQRKPPAVAWSATAAWEREASA